mgnify:CR=1 FL=1
MTMSGPSTFNEIISAGLLGYSLLLALVSLIPALRQQGLRLFVVLTAGGLAVLSHHWASYLVALFVIAVAALLAIFLRVETAVAFLGGAIMGYGARLARGCTSGQALSGGAVLSVGSWAFMFAVFGGGYALAYFVRKTWN